MPQKSVKSPSTLTIHSLRYEISYKLLKLKVTVAFVNAISAYFEIVNI